MTIEPILSRVAAWAFFAVPSLARRVGGDCADFVVCAGGPRRPKECPRLRFGTADRGQVGLVWERGPAHVLKSDSYGRTTTCGHLKSSSAMHVAHQCVYLQYAQKLALRESVCAAESADHQTGG